MSEPTARDESLRRWLLVIAAILVVAKCGHENRHRWLNARLAALEAQHAEEGR